MAPSNDYSKSTFRAMKQMISAFSVQDLKEFLLFCNQNRHGRKADLQKRVLEHLKNNRTQSMEIKIKQLYDNIIAKRQVVPNPSQTPTPTYTPSGHPLIRPAVLTQFSDLPTFNRNVNYNTQNANYSFPPPPFSQNFPTLHSAFVAFPELPFYEQQSYLVSPSQFNAQYTTGNTSNFSFQIHLSAEEVASIQDNLKRNSLGKQEYGVQAQLRIRNTNCTSTITDDFPCGLVVKVNNTIIQLPPPIPSTNRPGMNVKRFGFAINITYAMSLRPNNTNTVYIEWVTDEHNYAFIVALVKKVSSDSLIDRVIKECVAEDGPSNTLSQLKSSSELSEIQVRTVRVSLMCPIGKIRIKYPCRAITCPHEQCFDASLYIKLNELRPVWTCPVCNNPASYKDLRIDKYILDILNSNSLEDETTEIYVAVDGNWTQIPNEEDQDGRRKKILKRCNSKEESDHSKSDSSDSDEDYSDDEKNVDTAAPSGSSSTTSEKSKSKDDNSEGGSEKPNEIQVVDINECNAAPIPAQNPGTPVLDSGDDESHWTVVDQCSDSSCESSSTVTVFPVSQKLASSNGKKCTSMSPITVYSSPGASSPDSVRIECTKFLQPSQNGCSSKPSPVLVDLTDSTDTSEVDDIKCLSKCPMKISLSKRSVKRKKVDAAAVSSKKKTVPAFSGSSTGFRTPAVVTKEIASIRLPPPVYDVSDSE